MRVRCRISEKPDDPTYAPTDGGDRFTSTDITRRGDYDLMMLAVNAVIFGDDEFRRRVCAMADIEVT